MTRLDFGDLNVTHGLLHMLFMKAIFIRCNAVRFLYGLNHWQWSSHCKIGVGKIEICFNL